jgi:membrane protease YdiL (CAAX protease family)
VTLPDLLALAVLLVVLPVLTLAQLRHLGEVEIRPLPVYVSSAVTALFLGGLSLAVGARHGGWSGVGLRPLPTGVLLAWSAGLAGGGVAVLFLFRAVAGRLELREKPLLRALLPRTSRERTAFVGLSMAAGVGEELAYRGYAITLLAGVLGGFGAAVLTSVVFGVMHAYQGVLGVVRTAMLGGLLAWGFLTAGSLWPAMLAHAAIDVLAGTVLTDRLVVPDKDSGVPEEEDGTPATPP